MHFCDQAVLLQVFLGGLAATMRADAGFKGGWYDPQKPPTVGPRAFARVYAGWGFSQPFYWEQVWFPVAFMPATHLHHYSVLATCVQCFGVGLLSFGLKLLSPKGPSSGNVGSGIPH